jgi:hypothetical protein
MGAAAAQQFALGGAMDDMTPLGQYIFSLYWSAVTFATVRVVIGGCALPFHQTNQRTPDSDHSTCIQPQPTTFDPTRSGTETSTRRPWQRRPFASCTSTSTVRTVARLICTLLARKAVVLTIPSNFDSLHVINTRLRWNTVFVGAYIIGERP